MSFISFLLSLFKSKPKPADKPEDSTSSNPFAGPENPAQIVDGFLVISNCKEAQWFMHTYHCYIPESIYDKCEDCLLQIRNELKIPLSTYKKIQKKLEARKRQDYELNETASLNNKGIALEKAGNIEEAIQVYEKNIALGLAAAHAYNRLMVIYRRQKNYTDELRVIDRGLEVYKAAGKLHQVEDWMKRREKVLQLMKTS